MQGTGSGTVARHAVDNSGRVKRDHLHVQPHRRHKPVKIDGNAVLLYFAGWWFGVFMRTFEGLKSLPERVFNTTNLHTSFEHCQSCCLIFIFCDLLLCGARRFSTEVEHNSWYAPQLPWQSHRGPLAECFEAGGSSGKGPSMLKLKQMHTQMQKHAELIGKPWDLLAFPTCVKQQPLVALESYRLSLFLAVPLAQPAWDVSKVGPYCRSSKACLPQLTVRRAGVHQRSGHDLLLKNNKVSHQPFEDTTTLLLGSAVDLNSTSIESFDSKQFKGQYAVHLWRQRNPIALSGFSTNLELLPWSTVQLSSRFLPTCPYLLS